MGCNEDRERPEIVVEIRINQYGMSHAANCEVGVLGNTILGRGVRNHFFIGDAMCLAVSVHLPLDEFRSVINAECGDFFTTVVFCGGFELNEK
jgi:hypothetical protein